MGGGACACHLTVRCDEQWGVGVCRFTDLAIAARRFRARRCLARRPQGMQRTHSAQPSTDSLQDRGVAGPHWAVVLAQFTALSSLQRAMVRMTWAGAVLNDRSFMLARSDCRVQFCCLRVQHCFSVDF